MDEMRRRPYGIYRDPGDGSYVITGQFGGTVAAVVHGTLAKARAKRDAIRTEDEACAATHVGQRAARQLWYQNPVPEDEPSEPEPVARRRWWQRRTTAAG